ncbi:MAG: hypothetical protein C0511_01890 [Hyphomicrobium sp.]|nr:hypothetical protein [Hyphomicrobium sp.]PPC83608.1 MAG: hypothetical protein CTY40_01885 [Hyphomicrobium sp.]
MNQLLRAPQVYETDVIASFGRWRRFGVHGPVYEILDNTARPSDRGPVVRVRVVQSGEELDYRLECLIGDPQER